MANILVACEFSGIVRDAFRYLGHYAISVDLEPSEAPGPHYQGDIFEFLETTDTKFDLMIAHPPCTFLCQSGIQWVYKEEARYHKLIEAAHFFKRLLNVDIPKIAIENPIMMAEPLAIIGRPYSQIIQPYQFGDPEQKAICLWLKNLPPLEETHEVAGKGIQAKYYASTKSNAHRSKERSRFFPGVASAMASQWGGYSVPQADMSFLEQIA